MKKVVVIAPTFNEAANIKNLARDVFSQAKNNPGWEIHLLVVDSHSKDGTAQEVVKLKSVYPRLHLLETPKEGLGKAYLRGFKYCEEKLDPYLIIQIDADGQHDPTKITEFLRKIESGADFVVGTRYSKGGSIPQNWGLHRKILSMGANLVTRFGFMKLSVTEWTNGYRAIRFWLVKKAFDHLKNYSGYVFQVAFLDFAIKNGAVLAEIPVHFKERKFGVSKINAFQYIFQTFYYVFTHSAFIKFVIVGFIGFAVDFSISYLMIEKLKRPVWLGTLTSTETAIICNFLLNNFWSFKDKRIVGGLAPFVLSFLKFNLVSTGSIAIQTVGVSLLAQYLGNQYWVVYKMFIIGFVIIPYSYILYNRFIWKTK